MHKKFFLLILLCIFLAASAFSAPSAPATRQSSMPEKYFPWVDWQIAVHPQKENVLYRASAGGILVSEDYGRTFTKLWHGLPQNAIKPIAFDPANPETMYVGLPESGPAQGGFAYKTTNAGQRWEPTVICEAFGDAQNINLCSEADEIEVDPTNPSRVYVGVHVTGCRGGCGGFYRSTDAAQSFEPNPRCVGSYSPYNYAENDAGFIHVNTDSPSTVVAMTNTHYQDRGMQTSFDYGETFYHVDVIDARNSSFGDWNAVFAPKSPAPVAYSASDQNARYISVPGDGQCKDNKAHPRFPSQEDCPSGTYSITEVEALVARDFGSFGESATDCLGDNDCDSSAERDHVWKPVYNIERHFKLDKFTWLEADPQNPNRLFVAAYDILAQEKPKLLLLTPSNPGNLLEEWSAKVLYEAAFPKNYISRFTIDPHNSNRLYLVERLAPEGSAQGWEGKPVIAKIESTDGGNTWSRTIVNQDYLFFTANKISKDFSSSSRFVAVTTGDIWYSEDFGDSWKKQSASDVPRGEYSAIAQSKSEPGTWYAKAQRGTEKSTDSGKTFQYTDNAAYSYTKLCTIVFTDLTLDPGNSWNLYAASDAGIWFNDSLQSTSTQAETQQVSEDWERIAYKNGSNGLTDDYIWSLRFDPRDASNNTFFAGTRTGGIFKSTNRGASWQKLYSGITDVKDLEFSGNTIYAAAVEGLFGSTDNGASWQNILQKETLDIALSDVSPEIVYAATAEGVYRTTDGSSWNRTNLGTNRLPIESIETGLRYGLPFVLFGGGGDGIHKLAPTFNVRRGSSAGQVAVDVKKTNTESNFSGYKLYYGKTLSLNGTGAQEGSSPITVPDAPSFELNGLDNSAYYIALSALNSSGEESALGFVEKADLADTSTKNCFNSPSDPEFDKDSDGVTVCNFDCDDSNPNVNPNHQELCGNKIDDNCNGLIDEDIDADNDGYFTCTAPVDCDDMHASVHPGGEEVCNGLDDDCDATIDESGRQYLRAQVVPLLSTPMDSTVSFQKGKPTTDNTFYIDLVIRGAQNIYEVISGRASDQKIAQYVDSAEGSFLKKSGKPTSFNPNYTSTTTLNTVIGATCADKNFGADADGNEWVFSFKFQAIGVGTTRIYSRMKSVKGCTDAGEMVPRNDINYWFANAVVPEACFDFDSDGKLGYCATSCPSGTDYDDYLGETCTMGETQNCLVDDYCDGTRQCVNGKFGDCTKTNPNCVKPSCTEGQTRECLAEGECAGTQTCSNNSWGECVKDSPSCTSSSLAPCSEGDTTSCITYDDCPGIRACDNNSWGDCIKEAPSCPSIPVDSDADGLLSDKDCNDQNASIRLCTGCAVCSEGKCVSGSCPSTYCPESGCRGENYYSYPKALEGECIVQEGLGTCTSRTCLSQISQRDARCAAGNPWTNPLGLNSELREKVDIFGLQETISLEVLASSLAIAAALVFILFGLLTKKRQMKEGKGEEGELEEQKKELALEAEAELELEHVEEIKKKIKEARKEKAKEFLEEDFP